MKELVAAVWPFASVTVMTTAELATLAGVPEIKPVEGSRVTPAGRAPVVTAYVLLVVPPDAVI